MAEDTFGYGQVANRGRDDSGSAFILGKNNAIGELKDYVKDAYGVLAKQRIAANKAIGDLGDVQSKGAVPRDIYEHILPAKKKLTDAVAVMNQKSTNPKYLNSPQYYQDLHALQQQKDELQATVDASVTDNKRLQEWGNRIATDPNINHDETMLSMGSWLKKHPLERAQDVEAPIVLNFDYGKFLTENEKNIPNDLSEQQTGLTVTTRKNQLYDDKGNPTPYFEKKVKPQVESLIQSAKGQQAIKDKIKTAGLVDDASGTAVEKATEAVKQDLYRSKDSEYKQVEKREPTERESDQAAQAKSIAYNVPIKFTDNKGQEQTWKADMFAAHNAKKAKVTIPRVEGIYDMSTGLPLKSSEGTLEIIPSGTAAGGVGTGSAGQTGKKKGLYEVAEALIYNPKDKELAIAELVKGGLIAPEDPKNLTPDEEDIVDNKMERDNKLKRKSVIIPFEPIKGTLEGQGVNTGAIDKKWGELQKKQGGDKSVSKTKLSSLVGTKGYEGYTEQEIIDYYKKNGYTVK